MAQRQFLTSDTSTWTDRYGTGSDGTYSPSTSTDAPIDSACTGTSGATSLSATNTSFAIGQLILIHQTQGTGAGQWELNKIANYSAGTITTAYNLIFGYVTGAQVIVLKQYSSANIAGGVTLTAKAWNGTVGGIVGWICNGTTTIAGNIVTDGKGFRGGGNGNSNTTVYNGEGTGGASVNCSPSNSAPVNGNGGGAGQNSGYVGSGGGNGTASSATQQPGAAVGNIALTLMDMGGAGSGGWDGSSSAGANGGGIVLIISKTITVSGSITCRGNVASSVNASGGNGAGGSVLLKGQALTLGSTLIQAPQNGSGTGGYGAGPTGGGAGRIHADYGTSISGTTNPAIDSTQDVMLNDFGGGALYSLL